jgi:UDP-N-acetylmuramate: L-alanyl-gamma-D-glutamyl-meso-diaminopimelate ligase
MHERFPGRRLVAVFEPRSATSRRAVFQEEYARAFSEADVIFVAQPFDQSKLKETDRFSTDKLIRDLRQKGKVAETAQDVPGLVSKMASLTQPKDVILIMSNGGFDGIYQKLFTQLQA